MYEYFYYVQAQPRPGPAPARTRPRPGPSPMCLNFFQPRPGTGPQYVGPCPALPAKLCRGPARPAGCLDSKPGPRRAQLYTQCMHCGYFCTAPTFDTHVGITLCRSWLVVCTKPVGTKMVVLQQTTLFLPNVGQLLFITGCGTSDQNLGLSRGTYDMCNIICTYCVLSHQPDINASQCTPVTRQYTLI